MRGTAAMIKVYSILDAEPYLLQFDAILFDLDDTLYSEKDYIRSGFHQVAMLFPDDIDVEKKLWDYFISKKPAIDSLLSEKRIVDVNFKEQCLQAYRSQKPQLSLYPGAWEMLCRLRRQNKKLGLITDGRPNGQKAKIEGLGIQELFDKIVITDELGGTDFRKPNTAAFALMAEYFGTAFEKMCYVGDNIQKDFIAPEKLGMHSIWFQNTDGIYYDYS